MDLFILFLINVALFVTAELLRPKPELEDAQATPYEDANFPSIDPSAKIPVFIGNERNGSPHVMNVTEYNTIEIREKIKTGMFSSEKVVRGHRYLVGMALGLGVGELTLRRIMYDDVEIWTGTAAANDDGIAIDIDLPEQLGGEQNGGGLVGRLRFFAGTATQNQAAYLAPFESEGVAYRHTAYLILENFEVGETPNLKPFSFELEAYPNPLGLPAGELQNGKDVSMMSIAAEVFVNDDWGFGLDVADLTGFTTSATTLDTELNFGTMKLFRETKLQDILGNVSKQVDGQHRYRADLGKWEYKLNRDDYTIGSLPVFEQGAEVKTIRNFKRATYEDLSNLIEIGYSNRVTKHKPSPAIAHDGSLYERLGGRNNPATKRYPFVYDAALAQKIASRVLNKAAFAFAAVDIVVDRNAYSLLPGDVINWKWPDLGIVQLPMRVMKISLGTPDNPEIVISCVEDIFGQPGAIFSDPPASSYTPVAGAPTPIVTVKAVDQPYFIALQDGDRVDDISVEPSQEKPMIAALKPQGNALNYDLSAKVNGSPDPFVIESTANGYCPTGTLQDAIAESAGDTLATVVVLNVADAAKLTTFTPFIDSEIQEQGDGLLMFVPVTGEPEFMAYESLAISGTTVTLTNVHRAMIDTLEKDYAIGDRIWFIGAQGVSTTLSEAWTDTQVINIELFNRATTGNSTALAFNVTMRDRIAKPYPPGFFRVEGIRFPSATFAINSDFNITWRHRDRLLDTAAFQGDASEAAIESGFEYVLEIYDDIVDALERRIRPTGSGNTPAGDDVFDFDDGTGSGYDYLLADQTADGGPFARMRAELWVEESVTGAAVNRSLLTTIRVWSVVIPVNFFKRGPIYNSLAAVTPADIYPLTGDSDFDGTLEGLTSTSLGTQVGDNAPGPSPIITGVTIPGSNAAAADWTGNLDLPDGTLNTWDRHVGYIEMFHFKLVKDAQTNRRYIIAKDNAANINGNTFRTLISSTGVWEDQYGTNDILQNDCCNSLDWEDGRWHQAAVFSWRVASNSQRRVYMIDGVFVFKNNDGFAPSTSAHSASVGGPDAAETASFGWAKLFMSQLMSKVGYTPHLSSGTDDEFIMKAQSDGMQRSPWQMQALGMFKDAWIRGGVGDDATTTMGLPDFSGNAVQTNIDYAPDNSNWVQDSGFAVQITKVGTTAADAITAGPIADSWSYKTDMVDTGAFAYFNIPTDYFNATPVGSATTAHVNVAADWPKLFAVHAIINADNFTNPVALVSIAAERINFTETDQPHQFDIWIETDGRIKINVEQDNSNYRVHRTDNVCCVTGVDLHISVFNVDTTGWEVWVNGKEFTVDNSFSTLGTPPAVDDWMNARPTGTLTSSMRPRVFNWGDDTPNGSPGAGIPRLDGRHMEWGAVKDVEWHGDDHVLLYAASFKGFATMKDIILDFSPFNAYQILDNTAIDLRGVMGAVTPTGTFTTDEEVPVPAWDLTKPQRFQASAANRLDYTTHFLSGMGTGLLDDFSLVVIGQLASDVLSALIFNRNAGSQSNFSVIYDNTTDRLEYKTTGGTAIVGPTGLTGGDTFCGIMTHFDDAGTDRWNWWDGDAGQPGPEVTTANAYSGAAITDGRIGVSDGGGAPLDGTLHYTSAFDRTITPEHARRIALAYRGFTGAMLEIHKHIDDTEAQAQPGFIFPLDERDLATQAENWVINDAGIQNMTLNGSGVTQEKGLVTCGHARYPMLASATYLEGTSPNFAAAYPLTIGVQVRVDSGTDAMVSITDPSGSDNFIALGIIGGKAAIRFDATAITGPIDEVGTTVVTAGEFATVSVTFESNTVRRLYLNNKLEATFTTSYALATMIGALDTATVNRISGPNTNFDGSYQMFWGVQADLNDEAHMIIHAAHRPFGWEAISAFKDDTPAAQWLLNEPASQITGLYRDQVNDDYGAADVSTGVTQGQAGIVPGRRDICCDFNGVNGGIDTNFLAYETGTNNRAFECWLEAGFTGTVISMGANVDAQALVISVDGSGDVSIHIRGASNERIWTTALDVGTEHHLLVMLDGTTLHSFQVWIDGVEQTTIGTAGNNTALGTVATLDLHIADDITDIGKADGNGKLYGVTAYNLGASGVITDDDIALRNAAGRAIYSGVSW